MPETYDRDLPTYGDLMTVEDFMECVSCGLFIDYDGSGHPVKNGRMSKLNIYPSQCPGVIPEDATHIMWFNK